MIFLIEYNRNEERLVSLRAFDNSQRREAENARLDAELSLNHNGTGNEVVLLEADSEEAVRKTHRRYFENARQILNSNTNILDFETVLLSNSKLNSATSPTR